MDKKDSRIIGEYESGESGSLLFVTAAVHGNEPSGVKALERVITELVKSKPPIKGKIIGVLGNLSAYKMKARFIDEDLNRTWTSENIKNNTKNTNEKKEMFEIIDVLDSYKSHKLSKRYFLDCHTTSSESSPYISVQEINDNDTWAHLFPLHIIRGFSDIVSGTIDHYFSDEGITGFTLEAGQHNSRNAIDYHEGIIWLALQKANGLSFDYLSNFPEAVSKTEKFKKEQKTFHIIYRHGINDSDKFEMQAGLKNFQPVKRGQLLAHQNGVPLICEWNAYIFMPLYQSQGNDGFFIVEEVR